MFRKKHSSLMMLALTLVRVTSGILSSVTASTAMTKHPLEDVKSWKLFVQRQRQQRQDREEEEEEEEEEDQQQIHSGRRVLLKRGKKKTEKKMKYSGGVDNDDDDYQKKKNSHHPDYTYQDIEITHIQHNHKIPIADGTSMHGIMIDAGSVRLCLTTFQFLFFSHDT
jgi:hypothetical protein